MTRTAGAAINCQNYLHKPAIAPARDRQKGGMYRVWPAYPASIDSSCRAWS